MTNLKEITVKLPQEWVEHLEQLAKDTDKDKDYYVKESLYRYLEDLEDYEIGIQALKSQGSTFTSGEVKEHLKQYYSQK